jgi:hypothetical protein
MASTVADRLHHCRSPGHLHAPPRRTLAMRLGFAGAVRPLPRIFGCSPLTTTTSNVVNNPAPSCGSMAAPARRLPDACDHSRFSVFSQDLVWLLQIDGVVVVLLLHYAPQHQSPLRRLRSGSPSVPLQFLLSCYTTSHE